MPNMSYCRFENTLIDVNDCINALEERNISSNREKSKASKMLTSICKFLVVEGIIDNYDQDIINGLIEVCGEQEDEEDE